MKRRWSHGWRRSQDFWLRLSGAKENPLKTQKTVRALRRALREIRDGCRPHFDDYGGDMVQDSDCFCCRCIAVRALQS